jgi:hypothetical protein
MPRAQLYKSTANHDVHGVTLLRLFPLERVRRPAQCAN